MRTESTPLILVVDDDWMNRDLLQTHLQVAGYNVMTANSGEKALEIVGRQMPDLVLLDVRMHGMNGYEVCARLKGNEATRHIPVIIVTALDKDDDYQKAVEVGVDDFLPKPFNSILMLTRIRSLLRVKYQHDLLMQREERLRAVLDQYVAPETAAQILADLEG